MSGPDYLDYQFSGNAFSIAFSASSGNASTSRGGTSSLSPWSADLKLCVGTYAETAAENNLTVIGLNPQLLQDPESYAQNNFGQDSSQDFVPLAKQKTSYPVTKVDFAPTSLTSKLQTNAESRDMIASTSDCLRLWDLVSQESGQSQYVGRSTPSTHQQLTERSVLSNAKGDFGAPLTSFSWSSVDPTSIVTSSVDTTCTIWNISTNQAETQLISHDREVFDVAWSPASANMFASVGADGSVRSFDRRQLDHSTILFESSATSSVGRSKGAPLLRLAFNPCDPNSLAVIHADTSHITILDVRSPGLAVAELQSHKSAVNGIAWCGSAPSAANGFNGDYPDNANSMLASVSDDCQVLMWDLQHPNPNGEPQKQSLPRIIGLPNAAYTAPAEVNSIAWGAGRDYLAVALGGGLVRCLRV